MSHFHSHHKLIHDLQSQARVLQQEALQVFEALGLSGILREDAWTDLLLTCEQTATNRNSMLQDLEAGRALELPWLNGWLLEQARTLGLSLPHHQEIVRKLAST
jgi:ketopantoate reductase